MQVNNNKLKVLLVDDEPELLSVLQSILEFEGFEIHSADCGISALEKCENIRFDVIVTDLLMPRMDGKRFLTAYRDKFGFAAKAILATGNQEEFDTCPKSLGIAAFADKPYNFAQFADMIRSVSQHES